MKFYNESLLSCVPCPEQPVRSVSSVNCAIWWTAQSHSKSCDLLKCPDGEDYMGTLRNNDRRCLINWRVDVQCHEKGKHCLSEQVHAFIRILFRNVLKFILKLNLDSLFLYKPRFPLLTNFWKFICEAVLTLL